MSSEPTESGHGDMSDYDLEILDGLLHHEFVETIEGLQPDDLEGMRSAVLAELERRRAM